MTDQIGDKFPRKFGKYHLLGPLAQGGMGALYLAVTGDRGLERLLVIKTVLPHLADAEYVSRFRDEAKVVVKLSHGNLIPVFDAGQVGGELFLAMDFVEGKDLRAVWNRCAKKQVAFPVDVAVYIVKELCRGLAYAHSFRDLHLVHRDVSPPNVIISYAGEVKLTDFGLASSTLKLEKTAPGIIYGKVAYMSPEQARGEPLDGRSDLYAAGIVLWELLTGRQLFPPGKEQPQDLLNRARNPEVMAPSRRAPRVPATLDAICLRALSANRGDRFANCEEFREALSAWLAADAPATDAHRVERFLHELFGEDMERERAERERLIDSIRSRVYTLPPTDELRKLVESEAHATRPRVRSPGSIGRRASDRGRAPLDRRQQPDRRDGDEELAAVDVPRANADGSTVVTAGGKAIAAEDAHAEDFVGQIIDGRYRIDELIGEGGMGRVYLAEHVEIGRRVAVKILHPVYGRMPDLVERFRREARAASRIGHPHIVDVTDSGTTEDGSVYFVMEYLEGVELGSVIDREGALGVERTLKVATQICQALAAAHTAGIIHRDLKPENIFLTIRQSTSDFVKVLDFGIAKSTEAEAVRAKRLTSPGMAMGTPEYMAPEQAAGRPADERCDVYALAAIVYEALTGVAPYEGDNFMEILTKKATVDPVPPKQLRRDLPDEVNDLVMRAMARNPDHRPASMEAFEYELNKCLEGRGTAVAKALGMATDPQLVANLNPGLTLHGGDRGLSGRTRRASSPSPRAGTGAERFDTSGAFLLASEAPTGSLDEVAVPSMTGAIDSVGLTFGESTANVRAPRSGVGLLGWVLLLALLATGVGVMLFVIAGERSGHNKAQAAAASVEGAHAAAPAAADEPPAGPDDEPLAAPDEEPAVGREAPGRAGAAPRDADDPPAAQETDEADATRKEPRRDRAAGRDRTARAAPSGIPRSAREADKLLEEGRKHFSRLNLSAARDAYGRVAKSKYHRARGLLGLAKVAFEQNDYADTIKYAEQAARAGGGNRARIVLGHAYFKRGQYDRALSYYDQVLKGDPGNTEAQKGASEARRILGRP